LCSFFIVASTIPEKPNKEKSDLLLVPDSNYFSCQEEQKKLLSEGIWPKEYLLKMVIKRFVKKLLAKKSFK